MLFCEKTFLAGLGCVWPDVITMISRQILHTSCPEIIVKLAQPSALSALWLLNVSPEAVGLTVLTVLTAGLGPSLLHTPSHLRVLLSLLAPPADGQRDHLPLHDGVVVNLAQPPRPPRPLAELKVRVGLWDPGEDRVGDGERFLDVLHLVRHVLVLLQAAADHSGQGEAGDLVWSPGAQQGEEEERGKDPGDRHEHHYEGSNLNVCEDPSWQQTEPGREGGEGGHGDGAAHPRQAGAHTAGPVCLPAERVHQPVVEGEVHRETDGQGDHHRLQDVELPPEQDQDGYRDEDDGEHGQNGKEAEEDVPGGDHEDQEAQDHGNSYRDEGSVKQTFL